MWSSASSSTSPTAAWSTSPSLLQYYWATLTYHLPTPPQSCCGVPSTNPCLLRFCQRVPVSLLTPCRLSPAELCLPPTHATSVLLLCAYHQPMPTLVLPESAYTYYAYSGPARECLPVPAGLTCWVKAPATNTYHLLRLLWSSQRVPTGTCWSYLLSASPSHQYLPLQSCWRLPTYLQRWSKAQEEGVSTLSSSLSLLDTLLPAFQGVSTLFSSLSTPNTPLPVLKRVSTLFSNLSSLKPFLQVLSSPNQTPTDSPRSLPHVILPTSSPTLAQILLLSL